MFEFATAGPGPMYDPVNFRRATDSGVFAMPQIVGSAVDGTTVAVVLLSIVFAIAAWIYTDARTHVRRGSPIVFSTGSFHLRTPAGWFLASLLVPELFLPLYIDSREFA
jgi:hypothetical protein